MPQVSEIETKHADFYLNSAQSATAVVTIVSPFFSSCPSGSAPAIMPFPSLTVTTVNATRGASISVRPTNASVSLPSTVFCGFASGIGAGFSPYTNGSCMVPTANVSAGQTYLVLTSSRTVGDGAVLAGYVFTLQL